MAGGDVDHAAVISALVEVHRAALHIDQTRIDEVRRRRRGAGSTTLAESASDIVEIGLTAAIAEV